MKDFVAYPCSKCGKGRRWFHCEDHPKCLTGWVQKIEDGKMVDMVKCPSCMKNGYVRSQNPTGGRLACPDCDELKDHERRQFS